RVFDRNHLFLSKNHSNKFKLVFLGTTLQSTAESSQLLCGLNNQITNFGRNSPTLVRLNFPSLQVEEEQDMLLESHVHVGNSGKENMAAAVMFQRFQWLELQNI
ncbi:hypothetical protein ACROYT_G028576, partial [Oculina patagonica]